MSETLQVLTLQLQTSVAGVITTPCYVLAITSFVQAPYECLAILPADRSIFNDEL